MNGFNKNWRIVHDSPSDGRRRWQIEQQRKHRLRVLCLIALLAATIAVAAAMLGFQHFKSAATPLVVQGKTIEVRRGGSFQAALNRASPGDTIVLEASAEFIGSFELPGNKTTQFITIQSSALGKLPGGNTRVAPKDHALMPKIVSSGKGESTIKTAPNANYYRFIGVEITSPATDYIYNTIYLGGEEKKLEEFPNHIEFDRCYVHSPGLNKARRGFALNGGETTIKNSYISGFAGAGDETQAIAGWNGPGPYKIINNYIEGAGENILFGGGDPRIQNVVPSDIEIRGNHISKPIEWRGKTTIKNIIELKNARRVVIADNLIENGWDCAAVGFTVRNQDGTAPWSTIEDVELRSNIIRRASAGVNLLGSDNHHKSQRMKRVKIHNNLIEDVDSAKYGDNSGGGYFLQLSGTDEVEVAYNTAIKFNGNTVSAYGDPNQRLAFHHNIVAFNDYGFWREREDAWSANSIFANAVVNTKGNSEFTAPERNFAVGFLPQIGFVDLKNGDYRLAPTSRFKGKGENGKDMGCNIEALKAAYQSKQ